MVILELEEQVRNENGSNFTLVMYRFTKISFQPPLIQSIFAGDVEEVRNLLSQQQDVNFLGIYVNKQR